LDESTEKNLKQQILAFLRDRAKRRRIDQQFHVSSVCDHIVEVNDDDILEVIDLMADADEPLKYTRRGAYVTLTDNEEAYLRIAELRSEIWE
jgi:hypothetical protein